MSYTEKILNDHLRYLDENNTLLDMLLELEGVLDRLDIYAYKNWIKGEVINGPDVSRHFVAIDLMYPHDEMPDPNGAKRLLKRGIPVKYTKDELAYPKKIKSTKEIDQKTAEGSQARNGVVAIKNEVATMPVWVVTIQMPRKYLDNTIKDFIEVNEDEFVNAEAAGDIATQQAQQSLDPTASIDAVNTSDTEAGGF